MPQSLPFVNPRSAWKKASRSDLSRRVVPFHVSFRRVCFNNNVTTINTGAHIHIRGGIRGGVVPSVVSPSISAAADCNLIARVKVMLRYARSMRRQHSCAGPAIASICYYGKTRSR